MIVTTLFVLAFAGACGGNWITPLEKEVDLGGNDCVECSMGNASGGGGNSDGVNTGTASNETSNLTFNPNGDVGATPMLPTASNGGGGRAPSETVVDAGVPCDGHHDHDDDNNVNDDDNNVNDDDNNVNDDDNNLSCHENGHNKVAVCHIPKGNKQNKHTICISAKAAKVHVDNGDYYGECKE